MHVNRVKGSPKADGPELLGDEKKTRRGKIKRGGEKTGEEVSE